MNIYDIYKEYPTEGLKEVPMSVQELKDANADKMEECLLSAGYKFTFKPHKCSDGEEYEIIEIRGPKASGFFISSNGERKFFIIFKTVVWVWKCEGVRIGLPPFCES